MNFTVLKQQGAKIQRIYFAKEDAIYKADTWNSKISYYSCVNLNCTCRGKIENNQFTRTNLQLHYENHSDGVQAEYEMAMNEDKEQALKTTRPLKDIYDEI